MMMMTEMMALVNACGNDAFSYAMPDGYNIIFEDFAGFDDNWNEIDRGYDDPAAINALLSWLNINCDRRVDDFYTTYYFGNYTVCVGYASMDI